MIIVKKKIKSIYGKIELRKDHVYVKQMHHRFNVSPLLQSHTLEFAYQLPFDRAMNLLNTVLHRANMGASQSQRLMHYFGSLAEVETQLKARGFEPDSSKCKAKQPLYAQVDGGHLLTDEGYRETKVGRIFKSSSIKRVSTDNEGVSKRNQIEQSDYLAQLGYYELFTERFDSLLNHHLSSNRYELVLISDGAEWISNWQVNKYPKAVMILDFYHALEHLANYAKLVFTSGRRKEDWIANRKEELLQGKLDRVISAIKEKSSTRRQSIRNKARELVTYYEKNRFRMKYDQYLEKGYYIGSGAIESAISTLAQQRCKLVGQRWTNRVQGVLNIRSLYMSDKKDKLLNIITQHMGGSKAA